jgi:ankyrin repeat protein
MFHSKSSFLKAAARGDDVEVNYCLQRKVPGAFSIDTQDEAGLTALNLAARAGHSSIIKMLLAKGADPNIPSRDGVPPLMAAMEAGKSLAALALVKGGASPDAHNADYVYAIHLAAFSGDLDVVKALAEAKADLNAVIRTNGRTALHWAVEKDMGSVVEFLVKEGARTDIADKAGRTAVDLARTKPHMLKLLQKSVSAVPASVGAEAVEHWTLAGKNRVAHHGTYPDIGRKITEIFNFESRERTVITENLKTGAETLSPPESFDRINEEALRNALAEFRKLGGSANDAVVSSGNKGSKNGFRL